MENSAYYALLLSLLPGVGPSRYWTYLDHFGCAEAVVQSSPKQLPKISAPAETMLRAFQRLGHASPLAHLGAQVLETIDRQGAQLLHHLEPDYPELLRQIHQPPPLLFAKGNVALLSLPQIAIVGTRHPTQTGVRNAKVFARYLAEGGFTITSGLALGIDTCAHQAALKTQGKTIAVMATGIDQIYPRRHRQLAEAIVEDQGLLITEFFPGTQPRATHFPRRNRIISGLSLAVLVIEAAIKSGSLITARYALEQNREVFALPGSIHNPQAKGCHALIKDGAQLVESTEDIIQPLSVSIRHFVDQQATKVEQNIATATPNSYETMPMPSLGEMEKKVLRAFSYDILTIEEIIDRSGLNSSEVASALLNLEMKRLIKHSDWGYEAV